MARTHAIVFGLIVQILQSSIQAQTQQCKAAVELDTVSLLQVGHGDVHIQKEASEKKIHPGSSTQERPNVAGTSLKEERAAEEAVMDSADQSQAEEETAVTTDADENQQFTKTQDEKPSSEKTSRHKGEDKKAQSYGVQFWFWSFIVALVLFSIACVGWVVTFACKTGQVEQKDQTTTCTVKDEKELNQMMKKGLVQFKGMVHVIKIINKDKKEFTPEEYQARCGQDGTTKDPKPPKDDFPLQFVLKVPIVFEHTEDTPEASTPDQSSKDKKVPGG